MRPAGPADTAPLYLPLHGELMRLLRNLEPADWIKPTVCGNWAVRDLAAHLLDVDVRLLSQTRDGHYPPPPDPPIAGYPDLVAFLNRLNREWIEAARRMSPGVLVDLLALTGPAVAAAVTSLDPHTPARFPVAWAGEDASANWFDIGRDYTERWHHQQQIRDAAGAPALYERRWLYPALDIFMRVLPHTYRAVEPRGVVEVAIEGEAGGVWSLAAVDGAWRLFEGAAGDPTARVRTDQDTAWRLFTRGIGREAARGRVRVGGDGSLGAVFLDALAVMA